SPSSHDVPSAARTSGGHSTLAPVQRSGASQAPKLSRHGRLVGARTSGGHSPALPVHDSASSQGPARARQTIPAALKVQVAVQQLEGAPFAGPRSQSSAGVLTPSPQTSSVRRRTVPPSPTAR